MPYHIEPRGDKFAVCDEDGKVVGSLHDTKAEAEAHLRALYANVPDAKPKRKAVASMPKCHFCDRRATTRMTRDSGTTVDVCNRHELNGLHAAEVDKDAVIGSDPIVRDAPNGVMVALPVPPELAAMAEVEQGVPADLMHITLAYVADDTAGIDGEALVAAVTAAVAGSAPLDLTIIGNARFAGEPSDDPESDGPGAQPCVLLIEPTDALCALCAAVCEALAGAGFPDASTHEGYLPHITVDYVELEEDDPIRVARPQPFTVDVVGVYVGPDRTDIPLEGSSEPAAPADAPDDATMTKVAYGTGGTVDVAMAKADAELRYTLAPVYLPDTEDAHGEFVGAADLQKAFWGYLADHREVHLQHTDTSAGTLVECVTWPTAYDTVLNIPGEDPKPITFPAGTVYAGIIWTPEAWALIKAGKLRGLSMGGRAKKVIAEFA